MQLKGLRLDGKFADSAQQTWAYARNVLLSRGFDELENEPGDLPLLTTIDGEIVGRITTPNAIVLFTWYNSKTYIKYVSPTNTVTDLITGGTSQIDINPSTAGMYVEGVHCYNSEGDLIIAWTNGVSKPFIMNVTEAITAPLTISTEAHLKLLYLFPEFDHNNFALTFGSIISGGRLPAAAYFISLTYELEPDVNTNFGGISNPIFITEDDSLTSYKQFKGNASLVITDKAISVGVTNLDTSYNHFKLAVIQKTETGVNTYITKRIRTSSGTVNVLIDDLDNLILYNLTEVTTSSPGFASIKTLTQSNRRLRMGYPTKPTKLPLSTIYDNLLTPRTLAVTSATRSATTVTVVTTAAHGLVTGAIVTMNGWNVPAYNGHFSIVRDDNSTFHYTVTSSATDSATGGTCKTDILEINWISEKTASLYATKDSYKDSAFIFNSRGFRSDEVYALYLGLRLKTGGYYGIYHIPGREGFTGEAAASTSIDSDTIDNYKLSSTASKVADYYGKMGLWENESELYSSSYGTKLNGQKVRHHRFPSAGQIHTWKTGILHTTPNGNLVQDVRFTTDDYSGGGTIYYGAATPVINPSLATYVAAAASNGNINKYTALYTQVVDVNFDFNMIVEANGAGTMEITKNVLQQNGTYVTTTLHTDTQTDGGSGSTLKFTHAETGIALNPGDFLNISIYENTTNSVMWGISNGDTDPYIKVYEATTGQDILGLRVSLDWANVDATTKAILEGIVDGWEILYAKRTLINQLMLDQSIVTQEGAGYRFYGFDSMSNLLNVEPTHVKAELFLDTGDYTSSTFVNEVIDYSKQTAEYSKINKIKYLPAYNSATVPANTYRENCYYFETLSGTFNLTLANLISIKDNLYLDFSSQELVSTGVVKALIATSAFSLYGGDTFVGHNSVLTFPSGSTYVPRIWYFPVESILNSGMRYEGANSYEKFYPLTDIAIFDNTVSPAVQPFIVDMVEAGIANYYLYNNDYHLLNTIRQDSIDNELTSVNTKYPNRIYSSMPQPLESSSVHWKKTRIMDYFDMVNAKGAIYKMVGNEYVVYVQTEFSIFRGIIIDQLRTADIDVALKTTEMFDRPLQELFDADGAYIKPWNREGTILTPYGLSVVDLDKGSIYMVSDKADEISKLGIEDWFRDTVKNKVVFGTKEAIGTGVSLGYDDIYKRLLVSVRNAGINNLNITKGALYNWYAAIYNTGGASIAPAGWSVPTQDQWRTLITYLGDWEVAGGKLKETGLIYWDAPNTDATNEVGFNGRGSGLRSSLGAFSNIKVTGLFWSATEADGANAWAPYLSYNDPYFDAESGWLKSLGMSLRLIKNSTSLTHGQTSTMQDFDGNTYGTICIGTQEWMSENLIVTHYNNGVAIPIVTDNTAWAALTTDGMCYYDNLESNAYTYINTKLINDFTLSFAFERMFWVCFHNYTPDKYIWNSNGLYCLYGNDVHKMLSNNFGLYNSVYYPSLVDFAFNSNASERFLIKSVKWTNNIEASGINYWDATLTSIMIYSKNLCSGEIPLIKRTYQYNAGTYALEEATGSNLIYRDGEWIFDDIKDIMITPNSLVLDNNFDIVSASLNVSKNWYEKAKFITKFVNIRLSYTNSSSNRKMKITNITIDIKNIL